MLWLMSLWQVDACIEAEYARALRGERDPSLPLRISENLLHPLQSFNQLLREIVF